MSLKHSAILLKAFGLAIFLVPLFMKGMGYLAAISHGIVIVLMIIGVILLIIGNVFEAKAMRADAAAEKGKN
ncbi:hypothetical protein M3204_16980 [Mesobacillus subterraneus]|uniref:hypothetical protein n=1 Tax=Mesobacillus subterraneus TaxID=285983 RepID=UPI0020426CA9|nr:hypothetical protein [Mesobacillus subterraneus]MCM3666114.1 hypothetical protein [Mesobacillus subterraneus]MCM3685112.1 hypothetical protein [Mesobacillus subterraneus]